MNHSTHENCVSALLVGGFDQDRQLIRDLFRESGWRLFEAAGRERALHCLRRHSVHVVIAEAEADWGWKSVLEDLQTLVRPPKLIVTSRNADERLWAEALNMGAYDVLAQPFEREEVERVVRSANRHFAARLMGFAPAAGAA
jgi:DNA-binding response OmpR family regulator